MLSDSKSKPEHRWSFMRHFNCVKFIGRQNPKIFLRETKCKKRIQKSIRCRLPLLWRNVTKRNKTFPSMSWTEEQHENNIKITAVTVSRLQYINQHLHSSTAYKSSLLYSTFFPPSDSSVFGASHVKYTFTGSIFQCLWKDMGIWWER